MNYKLFFFYEVPFVVSLLEFDRETTFWVVFVVSLLSFDRETTLRRANWQKVGTTLRDFPQSSTKYRRRGADFGIFGAERQVFPPSGAYLRDFGAERQFFLIFGAIFGDFGAERLVFPPSGADFGIFCAEGQPGRAYPHCFWGGYVQKWPQTHIPSLICRRVCTGEGENNPTDLPGLRRNGRESAEG